jgi:hypothetical protein
MEVTQVYIVQFPCGWTVGSTEAYDTFVIFYCACVVKPATDMDKETLWGCGLPLLVTAKADNGVVILDSTGVVFAGADTKKASFWGVCLSEFVASKAHD